MIAQALQLSFNIGMKKYVGKVLVADDEVKILDYLCEELAKASIQAVRASDGQEAYEIFQKMQDFDAILSDITMPRMTGLELLQKIRSFEKNTPFVILSAHGTTYNVETALQLGAFDFIEKPWEDEILFDTVLRAIELGKLVHIWENDPSMSQELKKYQQENSRRSETDAKGLLRFPGRKHLKPKDPVNA